MKYPLAAILSTSATLAYLSKSLPENHPTGLPRGFITIFATCFALQTLLWAFHVVILYPKFLSPFIGLPEPSNNSFFHGQEARIRRETTGAPAVDWINTIPNSGLIRYRVMFNQERLLLTSPKALAEVLVTRSYDYTKPGRLRFILMRILGKGILLTDGNDHRVQRRNLMPAFSFRHIKDLYPVFWAKATESAVAMSAELARGQNGGVLEIKDWASRATLDIIGAAGLGCHFGSIADPNNQLAGMYRRLLKPVGMHRLFAMLAMVSPEWLVTRLSSSYIADLTSTTQSIRGVCRDLVRRKKEKLAQTNGDADADILSVALRSGVFSAENLVDQMMTFLAAGHETTASALTWAVYLLSKHPDVQTRLRDEIRAHIPPSLDGRSSRDISPADIDRVPYLHAVCNEVLRYFAPVPLTLREAIHDTEILGLHVPKGTRITVPVWGANKSVAMWGDDAGKFEPERWLQHANAHHSTDHERKPATSNYAFMTFLHGPRSCIGMAFAKAEFACLVAAWVGRFAFELHNKDEMDEAKVEMRSGITVRPEKGMYVVAKVVDGW